MTCNEAPRSSLLRRSSHFGHEGRKLRGILRNSQKPLPSFAKATEGSPRLHPRCGLLRRSSRVGCEGRELRGIRRRRINLPYSRLCATVKKRQTEVEQDAEKVRQRRSRLEQVLNGDPTASLTRRCAQTWCSLFVAPCAPEGTPLGLHSLRPCWTAFLSILQVQLSSSSPLQHNERHSLPRDLS